jgi:hypothetical protein
VTAIPGEPVSRIGAHFFEGLRQCQTRQTSIGGISLRTCPIGDM